MTDDRHAQLTGASLGKLRDLFATLPPPSAAMRDGFFRARFIGPFWLRAPAPLSVHLMGLPNWQGKRFQTPDTATNRVIRNGQETEYLCMTLLPGPSLVDGKDGLALHYLVQPDGTASPAPWRWVRDELRALDDDTLLGMTVIDQPLLRLLAFPFLLERAG
ncbi:MAG: hypothetical protein ACLGG6_08580 [Gammaproteobacteria bacterium]